MRGVSLRPMMLLLLIVCNAQYGNGDLCNDNRECVPNCCKEECCRNSCCDNDCCKVECAKCNGSPPVTETSKGDDSNTDVIIIVVLVVSCACIITIATLITVCYWISKKNQGNRRELPVVTYSADNAININDEISVSTRREPLPPTYEEIDQYRQDISRHDTADNGAIAAATTVQPENEDENIDPGAYVQLRKTEDESKENTYNKLNLPDNNGVSGDLSGDYSILNRPDNNAVSGDFSDDYNKFDTTAIAQHTSDDNYSHLSRPSVKQHTPVEEDETINVYSQLQSSSNTHQLQAMCLSNKEGLSTNANDDYEETIPNVSAVNQQTDGEHNHDRPQKSEINQETKAIFHLPQTKISGADGYEMAINTSTTM